MKNRNLILSVLFWAIASVSMAVTLPSSSYSVLVADTEEIPFTSPFGATFKNVSLLGAYTSGKCTGGKDLGYSHCNTCCLTEICPGMTEEQCWNQKASELGECINYCSETELGAPESPLSSPLLLLPFALAYALVRRRRQASEQA